MLNSVNLFEYESLVAKTKLILPAFENLEKTSSDGNYRKIRLGSGAFGSARVARSLDGDYFAVKKLHPQICITQDGLKITSAHSERFANVSER